jgi:aspartate-semialdehyde dehydrogenase
MTFESLEKADLLFICDFPETEGDLPTQLNEEFGDNAPFVIDLLRSYEYEEDSLQTSVLPRSLDGPIESPTILPNPLAIGIAHFLDLCRRLAPLSRVLATAFIPVSEFGKDGIESLHNQLIEVMNFGHIPEDMFRRQLIFNILPGIGECEPSGNTVHEEAIMAQVLRLLELEMLPLQLITVQVPVFYSYAVSLVVSFEDAVDIERIRSLFRNAEGFAVGKSDGAGTYEGPLDSTDHDEYTISRILEIPGEENQYFIWVNFDNIQATVVKEALLLAEQLFSGDKRLQQQ